MRRALADCRRVARRPSEAMRSPIQDVQPSAVEGEMPSQTIVPITDDARPIQWEAVFTKALRTNSRVRDVLAVLEIDADNLQEILRARQTQCRRFGQQLLLGEGLGSTCFTLSALARPLLPSETEEGTRCILAGSSKPLAPPRAGVCRFVE